MREPFRLVGVEAEHQTVQSERQPHPVLVEVFVGYGLWGIVGTSPSFRFPTDHCSSSLFVTGFSARAPVENLPLESLMVAVCQAWSCAWWHSAQCSLRRPQTTHHP